MLPAQGWSSQKTNVDTVFVPLPIPYVGLYWEGDFPFIKLVDVSPIASALFDGNVIFEVETGHSATLWGFAAIATVYGAYHAYLLDEIKPQRVPSGYNVQGCVHNTVETVEACPEDSILTIESCPKETNLFIEASLAPTYADE